MAIFKKKSPLHAAKEYFIKGRTHFRVGHYRRSLTACMRSVSLRPNYAAYYIMGRAHFLLGNFEKAIIAYENAIAFKPNDAGIYIHMGLCYQRVDRYTDAVAGSATAPIRSISTSPLPVANCQKPIANCQSFALPKPHQ